MLKMLITKNTGAIDPFSKRHRLVHNGGFPKFEECIVA